MTSVITTSNPRICSFYSANPTINFESINLLIIDLFENILKDTPNNIFQASINSQILSNICENTHKLNELNSSILFLKDTVCSLNNELNNSINLKYMELKQDYIDDLKDIIQSNNTEKIGPLIDKHNSTLIDKTTILISELIPKSQTHCYAQIHESIRSFHKSISDDTRVLLKYADNNSIKEYINNFEMKSTIMLQNIQQPIYAYISASEERIQNNIAAIRDNGSSITQSKIISDINECITTLRANTLTSSRSNMCSPSQNHLQIILNRLFSTSDISLLANPNIFSRTTNTFLVKRPNKQRIIIQTSDNPDNISTEDINEFIATIEQNNCPGVFLSQNSGFANKPNYYIELRNKLVVTFVHNVDYCPDKITTAIDIIDNVSQKLKDICTNENDILTIDKDVLEEINKEYQTFVSQKESLIQSVKDSHKKIHSHIDELLFPALDKYLSTKFGPPSRKQVLKCDLCKSFLANNLKALAAHKRGCSRKNISASTPVSTSITTGIDNDGK
jgi:hypothetical protein